MIIDFSGFSYFSYLAARFEMPSGNDLVTSVPSLIKASTHVADSPQPFFVQIIGRPFSIGVWALPAADTPNHITCTLYNEARELVSEFIITGAAWSAQLYGNTASGLLGTELQTAWTLYQFWLRLGAGGMIADPEDWIGITGTYGSVYDIAPGTGFEHADPHGDLVAYLLDDAVPFHTKYGFVEYVARNFFTGVIYQALPWNHPEHYYKLADDVLNLYDFKVRVVSCVAGTHVQLRAHPVITEHVHQYSGADFELTYVGRESADLVTSESGATSSNWFSLYRIFEPPHFGIGHPEQGQYWSIWSTQPFTIEIASVLKTDPSYRTHTIILSGYADGEYLGSAVASAANDYPVQASLTAENTLLDALVVQDRCVVGQSPAAIGVLAPKASIIDQWASTGGDPILIIGSDRYTEQATYMGTWDANRQEVVSLRPTAPGVTSIPAVAIRALTTGAAGTTIRFSMSDGQTTVFGPAQPLRRHTVNGGISMTYQSWLLNRNPLTLAQWQISDLVTLQIGIESLDVPDGITLNQLILEVLGSHVPYLLRNAGTVWVM